MRQVNLLPAPLSRRARDMANHSVTHQPTSEQNPVIWSPRPGIRRIKIVGLFLAIFAAASLVLSQSAMAAQWGFLGYNTMAFHGCTLRAGAVLDPNSRGGSFSVIGGGQVVGCRSRSYFEIWVQEQYSYNNVNWYNIGTEGNSGYFQNSYGMSSAQIAQTGRACGNASWRTIIDAYVYNNGSGSYSGWHHSSPHSVNATRC